MVSYFVPRGRFLIKAGNLRQAAHQKHQQLQQQQSGKWPTLLQFRRQVFASTNNNSNTTTAAKVSNAEGVCCAARQNQTNSYVARRNFSKSAHHKENVQQQSQQKTQLLAKQNQRSVWMRWTGFLLRWAPVGFCVFGAIEWQLHKQKCNREQQPRIASEFQSKVYCSLPLRIISRCWGWLAACYMPLPLRPYIYGWYSKTFKVNMDEALYSDFKHYSSLSEFFTRPLRDDVRIIDQHVPLVSPADGKVLHFGTATNSLIEQVKGVNYSIQSFLGPPTWTNNSLKTTENEYEEAIKTRHDDSTTLYQCVIYLAPGDYHRFHSPAEWQPSVRRHFSGELLSVSPKVATWLPGLFCLNERALYLGKWKYGFFSYTAVGATNVGSVQILMDEKLKTNRWVGLNVGTHKKREEYEEMELTSNTQLKRGELIGQFNMGSTIVLLFEAPKNFEFDIHAGQTIRMGESLGHIVEK